MRVVACFLIIGFFELPNSIEPFRFMDLQAFHVQEELSLQYFGFCLPENWIISNLIRMFL